MPREPLRKCPVCDRRLVRDGDRQRCKRCNLTVVAFDFEVRVVKLSDRREVQVWGEQVRRMPFDPVGKQWLGFDRDGRRWFLTWTVPDEDRKKEVRFEVHKKGYIGWEDLEGRGPRATWFASLTLSSWFRGGRRGRLPKTPFGPIAEGRYPATALRQDDYLYLVFGEPTRQPDGHPTILSAGPQPTPVG